jgi:predicted metal-dependent phosphoesterase TrpH
MTYPDCGPFDLQCHSLHSDGSLPAAEVVARAAGAGVRLLALTDHDSVSGVGEALRAGERHGLRVVPGIELSALEPVSGQELHILGYLLDHDDATLAAQLAELRSERERRGLGMARRLREQGLELDVDALIALAAAGGSVGRPHLAQAVLDHPANAERLLREDIQELGDVFDAYLLPGRPAFQTRGSPTAERSIEMIHAAGGLAVWAHPFWHVPDPQDVLMTIDRLRAAGLDGVEAFYPTHTHEQTRLLAERCSALDLLSTGSADFHGPLNRRFSRFLAFETYDLQPNLGPIAAQPPFSA